MTRKLMLDSGAFTVWTLGATVDLSRYVGFCESYPGVSYYVALDVIPGSSQGGATPLQRREACDESWQNYLTMCHSLPAKKVVPVHHFLDPPDSLRRMLDHGSGYIGIGGLAKANTADRLRFMRSLRPLLFDGAGRPKVRLHGFALTSFDVMSYWQWHSVDSTSWKLTGAWGGVYLPRRTGGEWDYSRPPLVVGVTPQSPAGAVSQRHVTSMSPHVRELFLEYLSQEGMAYGEWTVDEVAEGYSIPRGSGETWYDKRGRQVLRPKVSGVATSFEHRCRLNSRFFKRANATLPIRHLYFAGGPMPYPLETRLGRRLLSYHDIGRTGRSAVLDRHLLSMRRNAPE